MHALLVNPSFWMVLIAVGGVLFALFKWIGKLNENTKATEKLTVAFETFAGQIQNRLTDHESRISHLEGMAQKLALTTLS
jgi:hypothetical protein